MGTFEVELYVKHAPRTCKNFVELARRGYYNGTIVRARSSSTCLQPTHKCRQVLRCCVLSRHIGLLATS